MHAFPHVRAALLSAGAVALLFGMVSCAGKKPTPDSQPALSATVLGVVKGGKGSGVVGKPIDGVQVFGQLGDKVVGPATTDASGSFSLDAFDLLPPGTQKTPEGLKAVKPVSIDLKFEKAGYKTQLETVAIPAPQYEEFTFYMTSESE